MPAGYSGTPLAKKLGIKPGYTLLLYGAPDNYLELCSPLPEGVEIVEQIEAESTEFIHLFCTTLEELQQVFPSYKEALTKTGLLWISWPKGKSSIPTDLKRDPIRAYVLEQGLVDVKVAAVDEDWSGLKFVYRVKDR